MSVVRSVKIFAVWVETRDLISYCVFDFSSNAYPPYRIKLRLATPEFESYSSGPHTARDSSFLTEVFLRPTVLPLNVWKWGCARR